VLLVGYVFDEVWIDLVFLSVFWDDLCHMQYKLYGQEPPEFGVILPFRTSILLIVDDGGALAVCLVALILKLPEVPKMLGLFLF
jgi:hypothetical protein